MPAPERRIVITGMGVIAPNGSDLPTFWRTITEAESAAVPIDRFDTKKLPTKIGCLVQNFQAEDYMEPRAARRLDLSLKYGIAASVLAVRDAGIDFGTLDPDRVGVIEGTSLSNDEGAFRAESSYQNKGYRQMSPFLLFNAYCGGGSGEIALHLGSQGHALTVCSGSASGNDAIGYALKLIRDDEADVAVAGGAEATFFPPIFAGFCTTKVMTTHNDDPARAMKPFDRDRNGFLLGEGAAYLVMEELSHALTRGARIYAELLSHGRCSEAYHSTSPHPEGIGVQKAIDRALRSGRVLPSEVDYINFHGTATKMNDLVETRAVKSYFGARAHRLATSSTKPVTGHLLGGSGALETVICALALNEGVVPPTANLDAPDTECDLDYTPHTKRTLPLKTALNLSSGFGGKNSCLLLKKFE